MKPRRNYAAAVTALFMAIALIAVSAVPATGAPNTTLTGRVVAAGTAQPLANLPVQLNAGDCGSIGFGLWQCDQGEVLTDTNGVFTFMNVPTNGYTSAHENFTLWIGRRGDVSQYPAHQHTVMWASVRQTGLVAAGSTLNVGSVSLKRMGFVVAENLHSNGSPVRCVDGVLHMYDIAGAYSGATATAVSRPSWDGSDNRTLPLWPVGTYRVRVSCQGYLSHWYGGTNAQNAAALTIGVESATVLRDINLTPGEDPERGEEDDEVKPRKTCKTFKGKYRGVTAKKRTCAVMWLASTKKSGRAAARKAARKKWKKIHRNPASRAAVAGSPLSH